MLRCTKRFAILLTKDVHLAGNNLNFDNIAGTNGDRGMHLNCEFLITDQADVNDNGPWQLVHAGCSYERCYEQVVGFSLSVMAWDACFTIPSHMTMIRFAMVMAFT